jgi:hypothetical protein
MFTVAGTDRERAPRDCRVIPSSHSHVAGAPTGLVVVGQDQRVAASACTWELAGGQVVGDRFPGRLDGRK